MKALTVVVVKAKWQISICLHNEYLCVVDEC